MKLRVCDEFTDKFTGALYRIGEIIEVDDKRGAEIMSSQKRLAEVVEEPQSQKSASAPKTTKTTKTRKRRGESK